MAASDVTSAATRQAVPTVPNGRVHYTGELAPTAYSVTAQPEATREEVFRWRGAAGEAVEDYERRVAEGRPYEDTVDREEFRRRYGV